MQILLTNDDGIYAPGLMALERVLSRLGDVSVVAPAVEQSGVGHSITFLTPLTAKEIYDGPRRRGWAVDGSPADSVKLGVFEFCPRRPDLVVSGINGGLNAGKIQLFSGRSGRKLRTITSTTPNENLGFDAVGIGDVNRDHKPDLLASAAEGDTLYVIAGTGRR